MKKYLFLIFSLIFITSITACKKDLITLSMRAGTYKATSTQNSSKITITLNDDGTGTFVANTAVPVNITLGDPTSTAESFVFYTDITDSDNTKFTIDFANNTLQSGIYFDSALFVIVKQ